MDEIKWLENWMHAQCDEDWEHCYGVKMGTLDNPGWWVEIDIVGTSLEDKPFNTIKQITDEHNWIHCQVKEGKFDGNGDLSKLTDIIKIFKDWAEENKE